MINSTDSTQVWILHIRTKGMQNPFFDPWSELNFSRSNAVCIITWLVSSAGNLGFMQETLNFLVPYEHVARSYVSEKKPLIVEIKMNDVDKRRFARTMRKCKMFLVAIQCSYSFFFLSSFFHWFFYLFFTRFLNWN